MSAKIKIIPFGGVRENGKNMYAVDVNGGIYILDCGLKYPENELLGIDVVIPDWTYLRENKDRIVAVFLTHGHADAIGALPYFLSEFNVPVFGSEMTIALAKINVADEPKIKKFDDFHVIDEKTEIDFGDVVVSFFSTTHSIPESLGIDLKTDEGQIIYTGDFKFDQTAKPGYQTDYARLGAIGQAGVLALLSDSANAENPAMNASEQSLAESIEETFHYRDGRVIVACVASNILRIQQVFDAAAKTGRKVCLTGKDLEKIVNTAMELGKLTFDADLLVTTDQLDALAPNEIVVLQTGKMGEPIKAIQRMANKQEKDLNIQAGDLVYITTTPSHAMDTTVAQTRDMVYRAGGEVKAISDELNSSGHAYKRDLQLMLNLMKPKFLIPIQGEYRLLNAHAEAAMELGIPADHIFILSKGDVLTYAQGDMGLGEGIDVSDTMIDGIGVGDIGNIVLRDRKVLADDGIFIAVVTIDRKKKQIVADPKITSRGFVYVKANKDLMQESSQIIRKAVQNNLDNKEFDWGHLKQDVREHLSHYLFEQTHRRPVILPVIMEVNQHHRRTTKEKPSAGATNEKPVTKSAPKAKAEQAAKPAHKPRRNRKRRPTKKTTTDNA
ncbi:ribonuclease J [Levilactobacillus brevis]|uniref:Ribonuclease J n=2 Tax=Levilactobacillus brevis TaxID=1580 RepID=A0A0C1Q1V6_LEVBR|nr:ribonuclease J [Levilactobacillus brevis]AJA79704.1 Zn-dependent hydrolase [Levilactobacillus brevis BSO 464]ANN49294.1 RNase J family beta-CASP ribonuclease [Levilactobacillus brevis]KID41813.1 Ribonuclease J2 (endoribonuclease in RNA processing) [Levilactobacillus brevis]KIO95580.1 Ribonuclease J2 (endoribonuclease in RNA processing) [Levilactobacillus brevis]MBS0948136.1 ribonuclease J [Levilactobacillus brevis]